MRVGNNITNSTSWQQLLVTHSTSSMPCPAVVTVKPTAAAAAPGWPSPILTKCGERACRGPHRGRRPVARGVEKIVSSVLCGEQQGSLSSL